MDRIVGRLTQADVARCLREVSMLPGTGVHVVRTLSGDDMLVAESTEALAQDLLDRLQVWRPSHVHYKGGAYRVVARGAHDERFWAGPLFVIYDNEKGDLVLRAEEDFDGEVEVPQAPARAQRFTPLATGGLATGGVDLKWETRTPERRAQEKVTISASGRDVLTVRTAEGAQEHPQGVGEARRVRPEDVPRSVLEATERGRSVLAARTGREEVALSLTRDQVVWLMKMARTPEPNPSIRREVRDAVQERLQRALRSSPVTP